jgi:hypothetical protein
VGLREEDGGERTVRTGVKSSHAAESSVCRELIFRTAGSQAGIVKPALLLTHRLLLLETFLNY